MTKEQHIQRIIDLCTGAHGPEDSIRAPYETIADHARAALAALEAKGNYSETPNSSPDAGALREAAEYALEHMPHDKDCDMTWTGGVNRGCDCGVAYARIKLKQALAAPSSAKADSAGQRFPGWSREKIIDYVHQLEAKHEADLADSAGLREAVDVLEDVLTQACWQDAEDEWRFKAEDDPEDTYSLMVGHHFDSMALSAYAAGLRLLASLGRVKILSEYGRSVIAVPVEAALAPPSPESCPHGCYQGIIYTEDETDMTTDERPCPNPACHKEKP